MSSPDSGSTLIVYPEADGQPMTESDATRDYLIYCVEALSLYFQSRRNVYVSGNLFIYYREGDPKSVVSPDVFVIFGVSQRKRRSYKAWQEGKLPSFILEVTSLTTRKQDETEKPSLYASLGVQEYFQYDPTGDYLNPPLKGRTLVNGVYQPLPLNSVKEGVLSIRSQVLGLDLRLQPSTNAALTVITGATVPLELRLYDPQTETPLYSYQELEQARQQAEQERAEAEQARQQAEQERAEAEQSRQNAIARLLSMGLAPEQVAEALEVTLDEVRSHLQ